MTAAAMLSIALLSAELLTPTAAAKIAADRAEALGPAASTVRWLLLTGGTPEADAEQVIALNYLLNCVSRSPTVVRVEADGPLVAIDLGRLADPFALDKSLAELAEAWERTAVVDPFWHVPTIEAEKKRTAVAGAWCEPDLVRLQKATGSIGALLRVEWFIGRAGADSLFNLWSGVPATQGEFRRLHGIDDAAIARLAGFSAANISISRVTRKPRRLVFASGPLGPYIFSEDAAVDDAASNPFHFPVTDGAISTRVDAVEVFALGANAFWRTAIFNGKGDRVDVVPDTIAKNSTSADGIVRAGMNCVICHTTNAGDAGIAEFDGTQQARLNARGIYGRADIVGAIVASYSPARVKRTVERGQADHHDACELATGVDPKTAVSAVAKVYNGYRDGHVTLESAARELGMTPDEFRATVAKSTDPVVGLLVDGVEITRGAWESSAPGVLQLTAKPIAEPAK